MNSSIKFFVLISVLFICGSCINSKDDNKDKADNRGDKPLQTTALQTKFDATVALNFINEYTTHCNHTVNKTDSIDEMLNWVNKCRLLTTDFKRNYSDLIIKAYKEDPDMCLDFNAIFDAQDYPDKGFDLVSADAKTGYVIVKGKNWPSFQITLRLKYVANRWLVDGAGIINIPQGMRSKR